MTLSNGVKKQKKGAKGEKERGREDVNGVLETKKLVEWSIDEVGLFLCSISLPQYKDVFYFNEVDGEMLSTVDEEDLLVLPIERMGHRKKILRKVQNYLGESPSDEDLSESITTETPTLTTTTTTNIIVDDPPNSPTSNDLVSNSPSLSTFGYSIQDEVMFKCDILTLEETARYMRLPPSEIRSFVTTKGGRGLAAVKTSDGYRIHKKAIEKFMMQD